MLAPSAGHMTGEAYKNHITMDLIKAAQGYQCKILFTKYLRV